MVDIGKELKDMCLKEASKVVLDYATCGSHECNQCAANGFKGLGCELVNETAKKLIEKNQLPVGRCKELSPRDKLLLKESLEEYTKILGSELGLSEEPVNTAFYVAKITQINSLKSRVNRFYEELNDVEL